MDHYLGPAVSYPAHEVPTCGRRRVTEAANAACGQCREAERRRRAGVFSMKCVSTSSARYQSSAPSA